MSHADLILYVLDASQAIHDDERLPWKKSPRTNASSSGIKSTCLIAHSRIASQPSRWRSQQNNGKALKLSTKRSTGSSGKMVLLPAKSSSSPTCGTKRPLQRHRRLPRRRKRAPHECLTGIHHHGHAHSAQVPRIHHRQRHHRRYSLGNLCKVLYRQMNEKIWAKKIAKILDEHFPSPPIPLHHKDAYTLLIAVLLSAQCTDERVNKVTPALFAKASTPKQMMKLSVEEIEDLIRSCGLSKRKAEAIWSLSKIMVEKHHGKVPKSFEELEELPGVGHKTASVVMSQAFNVPCHGCRYSHPPLRKTLGLSSGKSVRTNGSRPQTPLPQRHME